MEVRLEHISKKYGSKYALRNFTATPKSAALWKFRKPNVHMWQYDEVGRVWTGSKTDKFVKSSEIVNISRLSVDILQNFWYCDGVRKVVPIFGKQVIPDGLMCSAM